MPHCYNKIYFFEKVQCYIYPAKQCFKVIHLRRPANILLQMYC